MGGCGQGFFEAIRVPMVWNPLSLWLAAGAVALAVGVAFDGQFDQAV